MSKVTVKLKPLSVNEAWKGRRFKTKKYDQYERDLTLLLPRTINLPQPPYEIHFIFGLSSMNADGDNNLKQTQDIIAKKYKFNDKHIKRWVIEVDNVEKNQEYICFEILHYEKKK